ncbi:hypothetical protein Esi_0138_0056 [Ectocarpus siliculosus]|uniref:Uncharacterized protein n=1 Tax=Ectocarpus siliculosus TaxID=2880 RepID=D7FJX1_ECTSI|nr:hypothetical protein Esi_0138_0056 [Ectocarpus siliculosus]|eukprot:CBJ29219.1 hypothetical protein Esi_0138_0056 [Ectocarpus siliculosus]
MRHPIDRLLSAFFYCPADGDVQDRPTKWCGYANDPQPVTDRLVEFAEYGWKNKAFRQMTFGLYCPPNAFCEQAEGILATYTAVGILEYWDLSMQLFNARVTSPVWDWEDMEHSNRGQRSGLRDEVDPDSNPHPNPTHLP